MMLMLLWILTPYLHVYGACVCFTFLYTVTNVFEGWSHNHLLVEVYMMYHSLPLLAYFRLIFQDERVLSQYLNGKRGEIVLKSKSQPWTIFPMVKDKYMISPTFQIHLGDLNSITYPSICLIYLICWIFPILCCHFGTYSVDGQLVGLNDNLIRNLSMGNIITFYLIMKLIQ